MGRVTDRVAQRLLDLAGVRAGDRVLDVATGTGAVAAAAVARGAEVTGVDISEEMLEVARERVPEATFAAGDAEGLALEGPFFDAVIAGFLINHLPAPERALGAWTRLMRPGGRLGLSLWRPPEENRLFGLIGDALDEAEPQGAVPPGPDPYRFAGDAALTELLSTAGLAEPRVSELRFDQHVEDAEDLWQGLLGGSVRSSAEVQAQPAEDRRRVREALVRLAEAHRTEDGLAVPVAVILGTAVAGGAAG